MTLKEKMSGSTGNAVQDGSVRGVLGAAFVALLVVGGPAIGLSDGDTLTLAPVATALAFVAGGAYDKYLR